MLPPPTQHLFKKQFLLMYMGIHILEILACIVLLTMFVLYEQKLTGCTKTIWLLLNK